MDNLPELPKLEKIEVHEQDGLAAGQAGRLQAVLQLRQLVDNVGDVLSQLTIGLVVALGPGGPGDARLQESVMAVSKRWLDANEMCRDHMGRCREILAAEREAAQSLLAIYRQMEKLESDTDLLKRLTGLNAALNDLERHRQSGLLEIIAKL